MNHFFGPVPSRRLGASLGVDVVPLKVCSYDCIYCQLGRTTQKTIAREEYVSLGVIIEEVESYFSRPHPSLDYITFSGSGEPTLNSKIGEMIKQIRKLTTVPVAVLTNGSLLYQAEVREDLMRADVVLPSLDAATPVAFQAVNRPHDYLKIEEITKGLITFAQDYKGRILLEILLCQGVNDGVRELKVLKEVIEEINPGKVHLNTVARPPRESQAKSLSGKQLEAAKKVLGERVEIIAHCKISPHGGYSCELEERILDLLRRRSCTTKDISQSLGIHSSEVIKYVDGLGNQGKIKSIVHNKDIYYQT